MAADSTPTPATAPAPSPGAFTVETGATLALFAYDIGFSVDLKQAEALLANLSQRDEIKRRRRAPAHFVHAPPPLRIPQPADPIAIAGFSTTRGVDCLLYEFGAVSVSYTIPITGRIESLVELGEALYENVALLEDSRRRVEGLLEAIRPAVSRPGVSPLVEDYAIHHLGCPPQGAAIPTLIEANAPSLARLLRAERSALSDQEINEALAARVSYGRHDAVVIDWNAAIVIDAEPGAEDVRAVLEHANVELLEMRWLDDELDRSLEEAYERTTPRSPRLGKAGRRLSVRTPLANLRRIARLQTDAALLFEGVNNALKLVGDQYLARVYRRTAERLHLPAWDANILRKINTLESMYQKLVDAQTTRRMEILEWIIIILIAVSIVLPFLPWAPGH